MNYQELLADYTHPTETEFYRGAFVKETLPQGFNPAIDIDDRPLRIILSWTTVGPDDAAVTMVDPTNDGINALDTEILLLSDLEVVTDAVPPYSIYGKWQNQYFLVVGYIGSMLKLLSLQGSSSNVELNLASYINVKPLTKSEFDSIGDVTRVDLSIPCNTTAYPLKDLSIVYTDVTVSVSDVQTIFAKLEPLNTTDLKTVTWSSSNTNVATVTPDNSESRQASVEFLQTGTVTITAVSDFDNTITDTITFTIS